MKKQPVLDPNGKRKVGMQDCVAYAAGDLGCNMSFSLKGTVQTFWLVYMALETGLLSILLLIVQIWDAINDPLIGSMIDADKRKYKHGKFKSYIFVGACGLLVAGAMVFLPFPNADLWLKCVLFIAGYILWDAFYTIANVPYGSMLSLVTEDAAERSSLSTWRSVGSMVGNMLPMILLPMLIWENVVYDGTTDFINTVTIPETFYPTGDAIKGLTDAQIMEIAKQNYLDYLLYDNGVLKYEIGDYIMVPPSTPDGDPSNLQALLGERVFWVAIIMGVIGFIAFIFMLKKITIRGDENAVKTNDGEKVNIIKSFGTFIKNRPAVGATLAAMGMFLGMQSASTANTIMFATYFGNPKMSGLVQLIGFLPMFIFMPFIKKLVAKFGKKEASAFGAGISLIGGLLMFIFPTISNHNVGLILYVAALAVFGIGMGVYTCVSWAFMADAIDYNEWKFGKREEGVVYSLHSFFRKLAQGVGPSIVLVLMGTLGYVSSLGVNGQTAQTAQNMCWLVAGLYAFSGIVMFVGIAFVYNVDKKTLAQMTEDLQNRRAKALEAETPVEKE